MEITYKKLSSYNNIDIERYKGDWDDVNITVTLPNGLELEGMIVCGLEPVDDINLTGFDDYIDISTIEELEELMNKPLKQICDEIYAEHPEFDMSDYIDLD